MRPNFKKGWVSPTNSMENPWFPRVRKGSQWLPVGPKDGHTGATSAKCPSRFALPFRGLLGFLVTSSINGTWRLQLELQLLLAGFKAKYNIYIYIIYIYILYTHIKCQQLWNFRSSPFSDKPLRCKNRVERKAHTSELHAAPVFWYRHSAMEGTRIVTISAWSLSLMLQ